MIPTHVIKLMSRLFIIKIFNVIRDVGSGDVGENSQAKQTLNNVAIKYNIKFINCSIV